MSVDPVAQLLGDPRFQGRPITWGAMLEGLEAVRRAWLTHVHAEEVLFKPFMEPVKTAERWEGQVGAIEFYRVFLSSLAEMKWVLQALVIGPKASSMW